jgi:hypothetical protein
MLQTTHCLVVFALATFNESLQLENMALLGKVLAATSNSARAAS